MDDPEKLLDYDAMLDLIEMEFGFRLANKTLRNDVSGGHVPGIVWVGIKPFGTAAIARNYARWKTRPEAPRRRNARLRAEAAVSLRPEAAP